MKDQKNEKDFVTKFGSVVGTICVACVGSCVAAIVISLTVKLIAWLLFI